MNVTDEQLFRVFRVDDTPETAPKLGLDRKVEKFTLQRKSKATDFSTKQRPYDGEYFLHRESLRFMATTPGGIEELSAKELAVKFPNSDIKESFIAYF